MERIALLTPPRSTRRTHRLRDGMGVGMSLSVSLTLTVAMRVGMVMVMVMVMPTTTASPTEGADIVFSYQIISHYFPLAKRSGTTRKEKKRKDKKDKKRNGRESKEKKNETYHHNRP